MRALGGTDIEDQFGAGSAGEADLATADAAASSICAARRRPAFSAS